jgi:Zn-dependent protease
MEELSAVQKIAIAILPIVFAITVHEASHAWIAWKLGDDTARQLGRVSFNPLKHIDPLGTVILPVLLMYLGGVIFGWAKPVPVDWRKLGKPRRDMGLVALAGPASNLIMAVLWLLLLKFAASQETSEGVWLFLLYMGYSGVLINLLLCILNLLPILPLDGGRILASLLPPNLAEIYSRSEPFGLIILLILLFSGALAMLMGPVLDGLLGLIWNLVLL